MKNYTLGILGFGVLVLCLLICAVLKTLFPLGVLAAIILMSVIIWQPLVGLCITVFFIPLEHLTAILPSFTLVKLTGVVTFWGWLVQLLTGKKTVKVRSFFVLLATYFIWSLLSVYWAIEPEPAMYRLISVSQLLLFFFLGYNLVDNKKETHLVMGSYLLGAVIAAGIGIYGLYAGDISTRAAISELQNPNLYGRLLGLGFILSLYFLLVQKKVFLRLLCILAGTLAFYGVLLSGSRGAWLALFLSLLVGLLLYGRQVLQVIKKPAVSAGLAITMLLLFIISPIVVKHIPPVVTQRLESLREVSEDRGTSRLDIWLVGIEAARHNPLSGVGIDNFPYAYTRYLPETMGAVQEIGINRSPHNIFIAFLTELGLPGLMILAGLFFTVWRLGYRTQNRTDYILCTVIVIFLAAAGFTSEDQYRKFFWFGMLIPPIMAQFVFGTPPPGKGIKTAFLSPVFPNKFNKSYGIFVFRLVQNLSAAGISVHVIAPVPYAPLLLWFNKKWRDMGRLPWKEDISGVEIIHPRYLCLPGGRFYRWNMLFLFWSICPVIQALNKNINYQLIHSYGLLPAGYAGLQTGAKAGLATVCTIMGGDINVIAAQSAAMNKIARHTLEHTARVVTVGRDLALKAHNLQSVNKDIEVIYNGVDSDMFDIKGLERVKAKSKLGFRPDDLVILYVGRIIRQKGVFELVEAFEQVYRRFPEVVLAFVGTGGAEKELQVLLKEKEIGQRVVFGGQLPHEELIWWYAASEMVVLFSHHDGVPNVIKEAMSCGRPVIATRTAGIPELVVDGETGILVEPGNLEQMAGGMEKLLSDPELGYNLGQNAREAVTGGPLSWKHTADSYLLLYNRLIEKLK